ncbi:hypothetical protein VWZ88_13415 [Phaeobacter sp. JH20_36]
MGTDAGAIRQPSQRDVRRWTLKISRDLFQSREDPPSTVDVA